MKLYELIMSALTLVVVGASFYFSYLYIRSRLKAIGHKSISFADEARFNKKLDEIMFNIWEKSHAGSVFIARLHNNGYWNNGRSMKKFTVILEKCNPTIPSIQQEYKDVLCSRYPEAMDFLFYHGMYFCSDMSLCHDKNLRRDFQSKYGLSSVFFFLIRQANGDKTEEAFIGLLFKDQAVLNQEKIDYVKSLRFDILGLLNMIEPRR
jgi:hypothetical protein